MSYTKTYHIGKKIKEARHSKGLSQKALGQLIGLPQGHISKIESGRVDPQLSTVMELSRLLDMEVMLVPKLLTQAVDSLEHSLRGQQRPQRPMYQPEENSHEE